MICRAFKKIKKDAFFLLNHIIMAVKLPIQKIEINFVKLHQ